MPADSRAGDLRAPAALAASRLKPMHALLALVWSGWRAAAIEVLAAMGSMLNESKRPLARLTIVSLVAIGCWVVYVPVHEMLHAFGCMASGGEVHELLIQPLYGGRLLERVIPFVRAGGDYAGRLSRFSTYGSDLIYLSTDAAPFILTTLGAIPLLRAARRRRSVALFGAGTVLVVALLVSLTGDLYEMGSILTSRGLRALCPGLPETSLLALRHDDLLALLGQFAVRFPDRWPIWIAAVACSTFIGWAIGNLSLLLSRLLTDLVITIRRRRGSRRES